MDYNNLVEKNEKFIENLEKLNNTNNLLKNKIIMINNINSKLEKNTILKQDTYSNLSFQSNMLKNEFSYYTNIYNVIFDKYSRELMELSEYILVILISLNKLEIENNEKKKIIFNKIIFIKKNAKKTIGNLKEIFTNIINNLKVVNEFIKLFDSYINKLKSQNTDKNLHSNNFEINIKYKKETIVVEYKKYCDKLVKTINYFMKCSENVINQIDTSELLNFFLSIKLKDNVEEIIV